MNFYLVVLILWTVSFVASIVANIYDFMKHDAIINIVSFIWFVVSVFGLVTSLLNYLVSLGVLVR